MEQSLRERLRAGEAQAFGELFDEHAAAVYRHGLRLTGDRLAAEDVVSTTFLHAWRQRHRIDRDGGSLLPWLLGIATNVCAISTAGTAGTGACSPASARGRRRRTSPTTSPRSSTASGSSRRSARPWPRCGRPSER